MYSFFLHEILIKWYNFLLDSQWKTKPKILNVHWILKTLLISLFATEEKTNADNLILHVLLSKMSTEICFLLRPTIILSTLKRQEIPQLQKKRKTTLKILLEKVQKMHHVPPFQSISIEAICWMAFVLWNAFFCFIA